jgi:glycerol-3-phosphate acyltransferase PlsX
VTRIALDASGGDFAPTNPVLGALSALEVLPESCEIVLIGPRAEVEAELRSQGEPPDRISVVDAPETIGMAEKPLSAVRSKKRSSIVLGLSMHKAGDVDAFISAGNTGAVMAASTLLLGLTDGVERPAIGAILPSVPDPVLLLDAGANVDCSAEELLGFAYLGAVYARDVLRRPAPRVGLLNIGEESEKGNAVAKEAHQLFRRSDHFTFAGNVEGSDILVNKCDVIACDGFVGNIVLKFYESTGRIFADLLKREVDPAILSGPGMGRVLRFLDYSEYGGAPLLGVRGISIICHGRSSPAAIKNAIRVAMQSVDSHLTQHIRDEFAEGGAVA